MKVGFILVSPNGFHNDIESIASVVALAVHPYYAAR
jgi:hypothetical protein